MNAEPRHQVSLGQGVPSQKAEVFIVTTVRAQILQNNDFIINISIIMTIISIGSSISRNRNYYYYYYQ
jgi:hypothetical protein